MMKYFLLKNVVCIGSSWLVPQNLIEGQQFEGQQWKAISELADKAIKEIKNKEKK
ncbi:hypothetical protein [Coxiella-like endosymbiont]|uniref:hypothetical protein n=1 Tax=Coxiella-like endosymbiont TaxID=1592897 RepID=UPI00272D00EF|nr:hypothetical protein [Coxiella-like endosymbiont]